MNKIDINNLDKGFPANQSFIGFIENQLEDIHTMQADELFAGANHIIKGVQVSLGSSSITLGEGLVFFNSEMFKFIGATVATTDLSKIDLYIVEDAYTGVYGDENTYPTYTYRSLEARVQDNGNFKSFKRSYRTPIREYNKQISINSIATTTLNHSIIEHRKEGSKVNGSIRTSSYGSTNPYFSPVVAAGQEIFDIYTRDGYKLYTRRLAGTFSALWYDLTNALVGGVAGIIVQENTLFRFYSNSGVKLTISQLTGVVETDSPVSYADIMFDVDIITDYI